MKYYELTKEEKEILDDFEEGKLKSIENLEAEKKRFQAIAKNTLNKTKNINIRLSERDVQKLKAKAAREGIPYQTLAASILHQNSN
jgi:predicted DNA binding CopG/RHH family protein